MKRVTGHGLENRLRMISWRTLLLSLALLPCQVGAIVPETGMYWLPTTPGRGYYIEHQNGVVAVVIYAYDETGDPEFWIASGPLQDDAAVENSNLEGGLYPVHGLAAPLFRVKNGRFLTEERVPAAGETPYSSERVGFLRATFGFHNIAILQVQLDNPPAGQRRTWERAVVRTNIGYGEFGRSFAGDSCVPDVRGEWTFVDQTDPLRPAWRFNFNEVRQTLPPTSGGTCVPYSVTFVDASRNAEFVCEAPDERGLTREQVIARGLATPGCELRIAGQSVFSSVYADLGLTRIIASLGALPRSGSGVLRSSSRVLGRRMD